MEHAWGEIEHEVVYKSGIEFPHETLRQFAAIAGALEILEREFGVLRLKKLQLIEMARDRYRAGHGLKERLDVARLLGFLESERPDCLSWRNAVELGRPFPPRIEVSCVEALATGGVKTPWSLQHLMRSPRFRGAVRSFAARQGIGPDEVSHLALIVIATLIRNPQLVREHFPEMIYDPAIEELLARRLSQN